jgi:hypothetical protein
VELFEQLRQEHEFGVGTIAGVAAKFGVHRRMVRKAIAGAMPPPHRYPARAKPKLGAVASFAGCGRIVYRRRAGRGPARAAQAAAYGTAHL